MLGGLRRWVSEWRPSAITLGAPAFPLVVLFGLNAVDELDRTAFAVLLPDIRDHFGLSDAGALRLVSLTTIAVLLIEVPLSFYCDRGNRVRIATVGAAVWALFSFGTGARSSSVAGMLVAMRIGAGTGRAVVTPTHSSLLSDYYEPAARVKVFSVHRQANSVGQILGPLLAGVLAAVARAGRGRSSSSPSRRSCSSLSPCACASRCAATTSGKAAGADEETALVADEPRGRRGRRCRCSTGCARSGGSGWRCRSSAVALFGVPNLLSLVYEEVFGLDSAGRGRIAAGVEPLQIDRRVRRHAPRGQDRHDATPVPAAVRRDRRRRRRARARRPRLRAARRRSPSRCTPSSPASIGTLAPAFFALLSIVAPPRVRAASFSTISVFAIPGIAVFLPLIGAGVRPPRHPGEHGRAGADRDRRRLHPAPRRPVRDGRHRRRPRPAAVDLDELAEADALRRSPSEGS